MVATLGYQMTPITVAQLIAHLQTFPQDLPVCFQLHSEQCLVELKDIGVIECQPPRPDGWVHSARPDKPLQQYLCLPGN